MAAASFDNGDNNSFELGSAELVGSGTDGEDGTNSIDNPDPDVEKDDRSSISESALDQSTAIEHSDGSENDSQNDDKVSFMTKITKCLSCPKRHPWWFGGVVCLMLAGAITYFSLRAHARAQVEPGGQPGDFCLVDNTCSYGKCDKKKKGCMCSRNDYWNNGGGCGYENSMCSLTQLGCIEKPPCPSNITLGTHRSGLLTASNNKEDVPNFGHTIVLDGDTAIVGQPRCLTRADNRHDGGSAHVFRKNSDGSRIRWKLEATLKPGTTRERGGFGVGVAIDGDWAMVGATSCNPRESGIPGKVYVFKRDRSTGEWNMLQELKAKQDHDYKGDAFGWSVALSGDRAVVGEPEGSMAYIYTRSPENIWERQNIANGPSPVDRFGLSVDIDITNDRESIVVGAPKGNNGVGVAYVYSRGRHSGASFGEPLELFALGAPEGSIFGASVAIRRSRNKDKTLLVVVGAFKDTSNDYGNLLDNRGNETLDGPDRNEASGSAYVFGLKSPDDYGILYSQKLTAQDDPIEGMYGADFAGHIREDRVSENFRWMTSSRSRWFGSSVDISVDDSRGERIVVGAVPRSGDEALAHVFVMSSRENSWYEEIRFRREGPAPIPTPDTMSRTYVAISGGTVLMGTPNDAMVYSPDPYAICGKFTDINHDFNWE